MSTQTAPARRQKWVDQSQSVNLLLATPAAKTYTSEEKNACSMDAMLNDEICEACQ